jgi:glycosyltransferase involved in cell wall biosynthesis
MLKVTVFSHKPCWPDSGATTGFATDGGFPFQMRYLSELFESTQLVVPINTRGTGGTPLVGHNLSVLPLTMPAGSGALRKLALIPWLFLNGPKLFRACRTADAIHAPIPGDIGTIGMILAFVTRKPLFIRHCGNWFVQRTIAERFWRWFMINRAGGRNVMMATGGAADPPASQNPAVRWIFSSSLSEAQLDALSSRPRSASACPLRLIAVARQEPGKGTDIVIRALKLLDNAVFDVVGGGSALSQLRACAESAGVADRVVFHGAQSHARVLELLKRADILCHVTASEGFPKAVLEALASGLPVITTRVSVLPILIRGAGVVLQESTPEATAEAVRACTDDPTMYLKMSDAARSNARQYSLERWRDCIGEHLEKAWGPLRKQVRDAAA